MVPTAGVASPDPTKTTLELTGLAIHAMALIAPGAYRPGSFDRSSRARGKPILLIAPGGAPGGKPGAL